MGSIFGLGSLNLSTGAESIVCLKDRHFWKWNSANNNWEMQSGAGTYLNASAQAHHEEFLDHQFWVNGTDPNRTFDGSTWSLTTNIAD
jgi:hypothetical protein